MKALELTFKIEGESQLIRRLQDVETDFKDWTPEFTKTGQLLLKTFRTNFDSQGAELNVTWPPLSPNTIAEKQRLGFPATPLVRTTKLRGGFRSKPSRFEVVLRNVMEYFVYHQSRLPRKKLPRRVMMKLDERRKQQIVKIFQESVQRSLQMRGFVVK